MKPSVYIRVNAEKNKGLGHWVRCTALASMLESRFDCVFLIQTTNRTIVKKTKALGFVCHTIPADLALNDEITYLKHHFLTGQEIVVLDSYIFDADYQKAVRKIAGKLVSIDDIHDTHFYSDVVINHAPGAQANDYQCESYTRLCLGLDYLLLRNPFTQRDTMHESKAVDIEKVFICMGGEDPNNDTIKLLKTCEKISSIKHCEVVVGTAYAHGNCLSNFAIRSSLKINISKALSADALVQKMRTCAVAICPPSTMALEYMSVSGQLFLHQTADNQKYLYRFLTDNQLAFPVEQLGQIEPERMEQAIQQQRVAIDGQSPNRLLSLFEDLQQSIDLNFRLADTNDVHQYFQWVNETETRKQSFLSTPICFEQHEQWFDHQLNNEASVLLVMEKNKQCLGQIRFQLNEHTATISYSLDKNARGKGLAKYLINGGVEWLQNNHPIITRIEGYVKVNNYASIKTFKRIGYQEELFETPIQQLRYIQQFKKVS